VISGKVAPDFFVALGPYDSVQVNARQLGSRQVDGADRMCVQADKESNRARGRMPRAERSTVGQLVGELDIDYRGGRSQPAGGQRRPLRRIAACLRRRAARQARVCNASRVDATAAPLPLS